MLQCTQVVCTLRDTLHSFSSVCVQNRVTVCLINRLTVWFVRVRTNMFIHKMWTHTVYIDTVKQKKMIIRIDVAVLDLHLSICLYMWDLVQFGFEWGLSVEKGFLNPSAARTRRKDSLSKLWKEIKSSNTFCFVLILLQCMWSRCVIMNLWCPQCKSNTTAPLKSLSLVCSIALCYMLTLGAVFYQGNAKKCRSLLIRWPSSSSFSLAIMAT